MALHEKKRLSEKFSKQRRNIRVYVADFLQGFHSDLNTVKSRLQVYAVSCRRALALKSGITGGQLWLLLRDKLLMNIANILLNEALLCASSREEK